jgi:uncharacterized membrane protein
VVIAPGNVGMWLGFCENLFLMSGGWILFASLAGPGNTLGMKFVTSISGVRVARYLIGISCLVFGLSHFVYLDGTASMIPAWMPYHIGFAGLTGAGHFAAGLGILFSLLPRLAATLEAIMISLFVALVHIPGVASGPANRMQWTMLFVASALAGAAYTTARSLQHASWGWTSRSKEPARTRDPQVV